jgi:hypothetical protein
MGNIKAQKRIMKIRTLALSTICFAFTFALPAPAADPLPSWSGGKPKQSIRAGHWRQGEDEVWNFCLSV